MNIEISYGDHEPDLLSQSLTGAALRHRLALAWLAGKPVSAARQIKPRQPRRPQPDATMLGGPGSPAALPVARALARLAGKAASTATGRSNRENCGARNPMQRRCADRPFSPFRRVDQFRDHPPWGTMGKREPQIILKNGRARHRLELRREGKFPPNQAVGGKLQGDKLEVAVKNGR
jgi:hypothetical protein